MTHSLPSGSPVSVHVNLEGKVLRACVEDSRPDVIDVFGDLTPAQQDQLVLDSWSIGVRTLLNAHALAQQAKLQDIGQSLVADFRAQLDHQLAEQDKQVSAALRRYFDPEDGQINDRLRAFLDDDGVLVANLRRFVGADGSVLAETLARQVGESSPLFKMLSPTDSEGLVQVLKAKVDEVLERHRGEVEKALDPLQEDGAVARFLKSLRERLDATEKDREDQLAQVTAALDANDEDSLLSRMVREQRAAQVSLRNAMDPTLPDSPLGTVKRTLEDLLKSRLEAQQESLEKIQVSQQEFQKEIREAVARIETRRTENSRSAEGGRTFEAEVVEFARGITPTGVCTFEATGGTAGLRSRCKVGDAVVRFTDESAYSGSALVIEAKRDQSYSVPAALAELDAACDNRRADVGLFVMAKSHASDDFPGFARYGNKLLVIWDENDPMTDGVLHGAIVAGLGLAQRRQSKVDEGDINALADMEQCLVKELERFGRMDQSADGIEKRAGKIRDELRKGRKVLERVIADADSTLKALNVEVRDAEVEEASPIEVPLHASSAENKAAELGAAE